MVKQLSLGLKTSTTERVPAVEKRIAAGARFLDERRGLTWRGLVDIETLDIESPCDCILGQLFDHFKVGCDELGIKPFRAARLGFNVMDLDNPSSAREFRALTRGWRNLLRVRQRPRVLVTV